MVQNLKSLFENIPPRFRHNDLWKQTLKMSQNGWEWDFSLANELGPVFPALADDIMIELFDVGDKHNVLDIGGGDASFSRANVVTDAFPTSNAHRSGRAIGNYHTDTVRFVECFAEDLPFENGEFDFAYSRSVFEHTLNPAAACQEMMRVAHSGYIETPSPLAEYLGGHPTHRWIITVERTDDGEPVLAFKRKPFVHAPFSYLLRPLIFRDNDFRFRWEWQFRNLVTTQFAWQDSFKYRVEESIPPECMNYDVPAAAADAHLDCAISAIQFGDVPMDIILPDIDTALELTPENAAAHNAKGCAHFIMGERTSAIEHFKTATLLEPLSGLYRTNLAAAAASEAEAHVNIVQNAYAIPEMRTRDLSNCGLSISDLEYGLVLLLGGLLNSGSPHIRHIKERFAAVKTAAEREQWHQAVA